MSAVSDKYNTLIGANPWIGDPLGPEQNTGDGAGSYQEYEGGASIYYTPPTGAHLIYGLIRQKWIALGREKGPNGYPTSDEMDAGSGKGRYNNFQSGTIIWKSGYPEAFSVHGAICTKWGEIEYDSGPLGFPITDEVQDKIYPIPGVSTGMLNTYTFDPCRNDFEFGAIYYHPDVGTKVVRSPILEAWECNVREFGYLGLPITDTTQEDFIIGNSISQVFQHGTVSCSLVDQKALMTNEKTRCSIQPKSRRAILEDTEDGKDTVRYPLLGLNRHLELKVALVIFRGSYTSKVTDTEINDLKSVFNTSCSYIDDYTFGLLRIDHTSFVIEYTIPKSEFNEFNDNDPNTFVPEFVSYQMVLDEFKSNNLNIDDFDLVCIHVPFTQTPPDIVLAAAWANTDYKLGNTKTRCTVHHVFPEHYWWARHVHEIFHQIEWVLETDGYKQLRNPDDEWWQDTFPELSNPSKIPPIPMNTGNPGEYLLYSMYSRIKEHWFGIKADWGEVRVNQMVDLSRGNMLMYTIPNDRTIVEQSVRVCCYYDRDLI